MPPMVPSRQANANACSSRALPMMWYSQTQGERARHAPVSLRILRTFNGRCLGAYVKTEKVFAHHGEVLAVWSMYKRDDVKVATGYNFVRPDDDGRFSYMAGFF